jgi:hypothetical protein
MTVSPLVTNWSEGLEGMLAGSTKARLAGALVVLPYRFVTTT